MHPDDRYMTVPQAAAMIGISANGMRRLLDEGVIPCIRPKSHRRVKVKDVRAFEQNVREGGLAYIEPLPENPFKRSA